MSRSRNNGDFWTPPADFRREENRKRRSKEKRELKESLRDHDDALIERRKRDVKWNWW